MPVWTKERLKREREARRERRAIARMTEDVILDAFERVDSTALNAEEEEVLLSVVDGRNPRPVTRF